MKPRIKPIDNVGRVWWRLWSVRLASVGTAITSVFVAFPDAALAAWGLLPQELKSAIPPEYMPFIGIAVFAASIIARLIRQDKLPRKTDAEREGH